jgi:transcription initiation factor TFIIH subunit 2
LTLQRFVKEFFDQNPISQLSITLTRNGVAEPVTELSGNPKNHENKLKEIMNMEGEPSLQNTFKLAMNILRHVPDYGSRELLIVYNSLKTRDAGDIFDTIAEAKKNKIRVSVICLPGELYVCKKAAEDTGGTFSVALDSMHLEELLMAQTIPPPELKLRPTLTTDFVYMGFPKRTFDSNPVYAIDGSVARLETTSYVCPRCFVRTKELPTQCSACRLQLNSSAHIARSHHHLFPVPNFIEKMLRKRPKKHVATGDMHIDSITANNGTVAVPTGAKTANMMGDMIGVGGAGEGDDEWEYYISDMDVLTASEESKGAERDSGLSDTGDVDPATTTVVAQPTCSGCMLRFGDRAMAMQCPQCGMLFCVECDLFIHDALHNCPGC